MRETRAIIERVRRVSADIQQLELSVDAALAQFQPGQSVFAWPVDNPGWHPYLREQWIPVAVRAGHMTVEFPPGLSYRPGQVLSLLSPVGRPIPLRANVRHMLLIAHTMPTTVILLARTLIAGGAAVTLVLHADAARYPLELLPPEVEILRGDTDWKWPDQVETLNWADQVIALAPPLAQEQVYGALYDQLYQLRHQLIPDGYVSGLFYQRLACGVGACTACQIPAPKGTILACTDGPAVDLKRLDFRR
ncbi:MAG: hypothetical protein JXQ72_09290 [Anaerolineae bacterium]|nr:hypothetical protein [Anaerolineae bacterium]